MVIKVTNSIKFLAEFCTKGKDLPGKWLLLGLLGRQGFNPLSHEISHGIFIVIGWVLGRTGHGVFQNALWINLLELEVASVVILEGLGRGVGDLHVYRNEEIAKEEVCFILRMIINFISVH